MPICLPSFVGTVAPASGGAFTNQYSVSFDGSDDYMSFGTDTFFNTGSAFSFSSWVKLDSFHNTYQTIAQFKTNHSKGFQLLLSDSSAYQGLNIGSDDTTNMMKAKTTSVASSTFLSWANIVLTYNGSGGSTSSNYKIYINGSEKALGATSAYSPLTNFNSIASGNNGSSFFMEGLIDEVAIFNAELSSTQVTNIYKGEESGGSGGTNGVPGDLSTFNPVGYWRMGDNNGGTGTTVTDQGSGGNNGTLINGPTFSTDVPS